MADISKITLPNGQQYNIKDQTARNTGKVSGVKGGKESDYRTGNVNLTPENIGAYPRQNYDRGTLDVGIRPLVNSTRANRLVFLPASQIIIEKTVDGGATWEDAGYADSSKVGLFSENGFSINIPLLNGKKSTLCGLRVIITGMNYDVPSGTAETEKYAYWNKDYVISQERYFNVREWWFWLSANNDTIKPSIYCATGAEPNRWINVFTRDFGMNGWSGSDWIRAGDGKTFGGSVNQLGNYWNWKLEFYSRPTDVNMASGTFISDTIQSINQIKCYGDNIWNSGNGGNLGSKDHLYSWDNNRNAIFPAAITATSFNGSLNGNATTATNANKVNNHTVNSDVPANAEFTDTVTTVSTTGSGNAVTAISASNGAITATKGTTFLTSHQDISGKADKSATVSTVTWDSTNKKLTKTINGTTTDVVTAATLRTGLNVADGAEVNQNAFSNVKVGSTTIAADAKTDTVELVAGSNITLTPDVTNDKITIAATDTKYTAATAAPLMDETAAVGTSIKYAREDHRHPTDTSRASVDHIVISTTQPTNQKAGDYWFVLDQIITTDYSQVANAYGGNTAYISSTIQEG